MKQKITSTFPDFKMAATENVSHAFWVEWKLEKLSIRNQSIHDFTSKETKFYYINWTFSTKVYKSKTSGYIVKSKVC